MASSTSTAVKCDAAFNRVVKLQRKHEFPQWKTADEASRAMNAEQWLKEIDGRVRDQLKADLRLVNEHMGEFPWHLAHRVSEPKTKEPRK